MLQNPRKLLYPLLAVAAGLASACAPRPTESPVPSYLADYAELYRENPRQANLQWFQDAKYGLFIHYGLYSLLEQGEWVQLRHDPPIPVAEYAQLAERFSAENFDPEAIVDLVKKAGMKYITITSKHHDGFALFDTQQSDFKATNTPAARDLIRGLYEVCEREGIGLFLYYSYAADWRHPYFYPRDAGWNAARPNYAEPQPEYRYETEADFVKYREFADAQIAELLTLFPNIAGIWLDPIMGFYHRPDLFRMEDTYAMIRDRSPHALISFKQGATGTEDFVAPERSGAARVGEQFEVAQKAYELNLGKPREICDTMQPHLRGLHGGSTWGYNKALDGKHLSADKVWERLQAARSNGYNLLLNVGPKPDGSIPDEDVEALTAVGERLEKEPLE